MGVSMSFLLPPLKPFTLDGGGGLAKGFGGPLAPAESSALADGEGGGSTAPGFWMGVLDAAAVACGDMPDPPSSSSSSFGICTVNFGPLGFVCRLFVLEGGWLMLGMTGVEAVR
jgi:hypothetical protein